MCWRDALLVPFSGGAVFGLRAGEASVVGMLDVISSGWPPGIFAAPGAARSAWGISPTPGAGAAASVLVDHDEYFPFPQLREGALELALVS